MRKNTFINIYFLLLPIIDLITSIFERKYDMVISIGAVYKILFLGFMLGYLFLKTKSNYRKKCMCYVLIILVFILLYLCFNLNYHSVNYLFFELTHLLKIFYFPLLLVSLICYFDDKKINICDIKNVFIINLLFYSFLLFIPLITNTGYSTYTDFGLSGSIGWFYSANEISAILILLFPFVYSFLRNNKILYVIVPILIVGIISSIGTKVSMFGVILISLCVFIVFSCEKKAKFFNKKIVVLFSLIVFASSVFFLFSSNSLDNLRITFLVQEKQNIEDKIDLKNLFNRYIKVLLSDRDLYIKDVYKIYKSNYNNKTLLLGLGYLVDEEGNMDTKMTEIDILDIFFRYGVISVIIVLLPFGYYIICYLYKRKCNIRTLFYLFMIFLILGISFVAGHILLAPAVSIYVAIILLLAYDELSLIN